MTDIIMNDARLTHATPGGSAHGESAERTACRECSGWKIAAERALVNLMDELSAGTSGGRIRLDISAARLESLMGEFDITPDQEAAGCAHLRRAG